MNYFPLICLKEGAFLKGGSGPSTEAFNGSGEASEEDVRIDAEPANRGGAELPGRELTGAEAGLSGVASPSPRTRFRTAESTERPVARGGGSAGSGAGAT